MTTEGHLTDPRSQQAQTLEVLHSAHSIGRTSDDFQLIVIDASANAHCQHFDPMAMRRCLFSRFPYPLIVPYS